VRACGCDDRGEGRRARREPESRLKLAGENPDVAMSMLDSELDDFLFDCGRARFGVREHQLLRDGVINAVGFDIKVVVVTDNKCHLLESTSNEQSYKIFSPN
jgi:hypothetical protein